MYFFYMNISSVKIDDRYRKYRYNQSSIYLSQQIMTKEKWPYYICLSVFGPPRRRRWNKKKGEKEMKIEDRNSVTRNALDLLGTYFVYVSLFCLTTTWDWSFFLFVYPIMLLSFFKFSFCVTIQANNPHEASVLLPNFSICILSDIIRYWDMRS